LNPSKTKISGELPFAQWFGRYICLLSGIYCRPAAPGAATILSGALRRKSRCSMCSGSKAGLT